LPLASGFEKAGEASVEKSSREMCRMLIGDGGAPAMGYFVPSAAVGPTCAPAGTRFPGAKKYAM
jgi:hypothetical protein